jgi:hydrogenase maturation protease
MTVVVGVGTEGRGDDAAGLLVVRALRDRVPEGVAVLERDGDPGALMAAWENASRVVAVDAVRSGAHLGTVHRLDATSARAVARHGGWSSHGLGLAAAIDLADSLGRRPRWFSVIGIEGERFAAGAAPSPAVVAAVPAAADAALRELSSAADADSGRMRGMADVQARVVATELEHPTEVALVSHGLRSRDLVVQAWNQHGQPVDVRPEIVDEDTVRVYPGQAGDGAPVRVVVIG